MTPCDSAGEEIDVLLTLDVTVTVEGRALGNVDGMGGGGVDGG